MKKTNPGLGGMFSYQFKALVSTDLEMCVPWRSAFKRPCPVRDKEWKFKGEDPCTGRAGLLIRLSVFVHIKQRTLPPLAPGGSLRAWRGSCDKDEEIQPLCGAPASITAGSLGFLSVFGWVSRKGSRATAILCSASMSLAVFDSSYK